MLRDHKPDSSLSYPHCTATAANWYRHESRFLEHYDEVWIMNLMRRDLSSGAEVRLRCKDESCYRECCRHLFDEGRIFQLLDQTVSDYAGYSSSLNDDFYEISFAPYN